MYSRVIKGLVVGLVIYAFFITCGGVLLFGGVNYCAALFTVIFTAGIVGILCGKDASPHQTTKAGAISGGAIGIFGLFSQINGHLLSARQYGFGLIFPIGKYNNLQSLLTGVGIIILVWLFIAIVLIIVGASVGTLLAKITSVNTQKFNNSDIATVRKHSRRIWLLLFGFSLLTVVTGIVFYTWIINLGQYPNGRLLTQVGGGPWAFCAEEYTYQWGDCSIGVRLVMVFETPVDYPKVENFYRGRYGQIGEIRRDESGFRLRYGPEPHIWDESDGPIAMDLGVEKPQFSLNMTPFYVTEEYSVYFRVKN
jgi:hypothetical protein